MKIGDYIFTLLFGTTIFLLPGAIAVPAQREWPDLQKIADEQARQLAERKKELRKPLAALSWRIKRHPQDLDAYRQRAAYYFELHQYAPAVADYSQVIAQQPDDVRAHLRRAGCYQSLKQENKALADLNRVIMRNLRDQDAYEAYVARTTIYLGHREYAKAIADFTSILEFKPADEWAYQSRADVHRMNKEYTAALADYTQLIKMSPRSTYGYYGRAEVYKAQGDAAKAAAELQAVEKIVKERGF